MTIQNLTELRAGQHDCYDRIAFAPESGTAGVHAEYVDEVVNPWSGEVVPVEGDAATAVTIGAPVHDPDTGEPTWDLSGPENLVDTSGFDTIEQVAYVGSSEGETVLAIGVRARLPMQVDVRHPNDGGDISYIDVAHRW